MAVKIQYPLIDEIVKADLKSLRVLLQSLFSLVSDADFRPMWAEVRDRLLEELDYAHEADNTDRMIALHADVPEIVIPSVVREATTRNVLTMELVPGSINPAPASITSQTIEWVLPQPQTPITVSLRVRPKAAGVFPVASTSRAEWDDTLGRSGTGDFPLVTIERRP